MARGQMGTCVRCGRWMEIKARQLCDTDYKHVTDLDLLADYPRKTRPAADFVDDYQALRARGLDDRQIAAQMGYRPESLRRTIERARNRGLLVTS